MVGGVPGAGKTTAIAHATDGLDQVSTIDPDQVIRRLRALLPDMPYRAYRPLVHTTHTVRVVLALLDGPRPGRHLMIHDPGTRIRRRRIFLRLARLAGWRTVLVYIDTDRAAAQEGQRRRGRVVRSFEEHWQSWEQLRPRLTSQTQDDRRTEPVLLVDRDTAAPLLRSLVAPPAQRLRGVGR